MPTDSNPAPAEGAQPYEHRCVSADADAASAALELWAEGGIASAQGAAADRARFDWFYRRNPQGVAYVNSLAHGEHKTPMGFLGIGARRLLLGGAAVPAGVLVDFVISPKHRSAFPALLLQRKGREHAFEVMDIVYGLPDTKAVGVCKRLESHVKFDLPRFARVVRSQVYLERLVPRWVAMPLAAFSDTLDRFGMQLQLLVTSVVGGWVNEFDASFDELWAALDKRDLCVGVRDREFLQWRFAQQPYHNYRTFVVKRKGSNALLMYFVCEISKASLRVKDCLHVASDRELRAGLLLLALAGRAIGASSVEIQVTANESFGRALRRAQFLQRSQRPFFAVVGMALRERAARVCWYVTQADEDV